jgi:hypothetical protein
MRFDKLVNKYCTEAVYIPRTPDLLKKDGKAVTKKGTEIPAAKLKEAETALSPLMNDFMVNPENYDTLNKIVSFVQNYPDVGISGKRFTRREVLLSLLKIAAKAGYDVKDILKKEDGGNGKNQTVDDWTGSGKPKGYYDALKNIVTGSDFNLEPIERSVLEVSSGNEEVYYFGEDGKPYRTTIFLNREKKVDKGAFRKGNRFLGQFAPAPVYTTEDGAEDVRYNPSEFVGKDLNYIRNSVNHDAAKAEFEKLYPSRIEEFERNFPNLVKQNPRLEGQNPRKIYHMIYKY